jgi:hypothetical protein
LFKSYLDFKLVDLKQDLISEQDSFTQKVKDDVNQKFKKEGNKIQFLFNKNILNGLHKLQKQVRDLEFSLIALTALESACLIFYSSSELSAIELA